MNSRDNIIHGNFIRRALQMGKLTDFEQFIRVLPADALEYVLRSEDDTAYSRRVCEAIRDEQERRNLIELNPVNTDGPKIV